jgi:predicted 3-demethylubiquinone-9 3-methyltransferase (glyoxalase superfamily)
MSKITPFLMFDNQLEAAIEFYTSTFPDSKIINTIHAGNNGPIISAEFIVGGQRIMGYNGGAHFEFRDSFSLFVNCENQEEVDKYWNKLVSAGAKPVRCGWITDQFGLSWQIIPKRFIELISSTDTKKVNAVMDAMMKMVKFDVAGLEKAYDEA